MMRSLKKSSEKVKKSKFEGNGMGIYYEHMLIINRGLA